VETPSTEGSVEALPDQIRNSNSQASYSVSDRKCPTSPRIFPRVEPVNPQITDRSLTEGYLRVIWWSQWREGVRLPAEKGVILLDGGLS
jgi:hypothetical protein